MDELIEALEPDEIEIDRILSEHMRAYATTRGYELVPGNREENSGGSYRRKRYQQAAGVA